MFVFTPSTGRFVVALRSQVTRRSLLALAATAFLLLPGRTFADNYYWDTLTTGTWATATNWTTDPTGVTPGAAVPSSTDSAFFNGSSINGVETVLLDDAADIAGITFQNTYSTLLESSTATDQVLTVGGSGITIAAGAGPVTLGSAAAPLDIALGASQTWTNNSSNLLSVASDISYGGGSAATLTIGGATGTTITGAIGDGGSPGVLGLTMNGSGTLVLDGVNTYSGTTSVTAGILQLGSISGTGGASNYLPNGAGKGNVSVTGAILDFNGYSETINGLVSNTANSFIENQAAGTAVTLTLGDGDAAAAVGTKTIVRDNSGIGGTLAIVKIGSGQQEISNGTAGDNFSGGLTILNGIVFDQGNTAVTPLGSGTITLGDTSGSNSAALTLNNQPKIFPNQIVVAAGSSGTKSIIDINDSVETFTNTVTLNDSLTVGIQATGTNLFTFSGPIVGVGGITVSTTVSGSSEYVLFSGANTYSGPTTVTGGILKAGVASVPGVSGAFGNNSAVTLSNTAGITLDLGSFATQIGSLTGGGSAGGNVSLGTATLTLGGDNTSPAPFAGVISGLFGGGLTKIGTGVQVFSGKNTYTGPTTVDGGTLRAGIGTAAGNAGGPFGINSAVTMADTAGATLDLNGFNTQIGSLSGGGASGGNVTLGSATLTTGADNTDTAFAGSISGDGGAIVKIGAGTWTLSGTNTFTGSMTINAGAVTLDYSTSNTSKLSSSAVLTLGGATLRLSGGSHTEAVSSTTLLGGGASRIVQADGSSVLQMGQITRNYNAGTLDFSAAGIATTSSTNDPSGILGGWATIGGTDWATNSTNGANGAILAYSGYTDIAALGAVVPDNANANVRINSVGTSGNNTLAAETTTISTLLQNTGTNSTIAPTLTGTLRTNAVMIGRSGGNLTIGAAAGDGSVLTTATPGGELILTNNTPAAVLTVNSIISDFNATSTLTVSGPGTVVLAADNVYGGATYVSGGTLSIDSNGNLGDQSLASTLYLNGGTLETTDFVNLYVTPTLAQRAVVLGANGGTLSPGGGLNLNISGVVSGSGPLTVNGAGLVDLSGANTYTGATFVNAGTLQAGAATVAGTSGAFGVNSAVTLADVAGATLDLNGFSNQIGSLTGGGSNGGNITLGGAHADRRRRQYQPGPLQRHGLRQRRRAHENRHRHVDSGRSEFLHRSDDGERRNPEYSERQRPGHDGRRHDGRRRRHAAITGWDQHLGRGSDIERHRRERSRRGIGKRQRKQRL